ncbi:Hypothetical protein NTJ_03101 [Nesidiocoris tenuis]|uniref:Uncharacterized protein n=1 Tax=Nesidiocoris tenuis TaxID=355587 RepID=A0ABN7AE68_9HEMI|nr:Hypothetical protein NTJ_03101 [Nesidiocoris tenuis]
MTLHLRDPTLIEQVREWAKVVILMQNNPWLGLEPIPIAASKYPDLARYRRLPQYAVRFSGTQIHDYQTRKLVIGSSFGDSVRVIANAGYRVRQQAKLDPYGETNTRVVPINPRRAVTPELGQAYWRIATGANNGEVGSPENVRRVLEEIPSYRMMEDGFDEVPYATEEQMIQIEKV